ncbi:MAG TPA: four helix bundle protein [Chlamydiales bacterium]|nr:four helix bundle protein [Chlamydiales bacterium]
MTSQIHSVLETPIFHRMYDLYKLIHGFHSKIPKLQRYTLWEKCENTTLALLDALIETSHRKNEERIEALYNISNKLDLLKVLFRLAKDTRAIDNTQYLEIQKIVQEIGRMVGGWIKSVPHRI